MATTNPSGPARTPVASLALGTLLALALAIGLGISSERAAHAQQAGGAAAPPAGAPPAVAPDQGTPPPAPAQAAPARLRPVRQRSVPWTQPLRLTILHTNDMHGQVLQMRGTEESVGLVALGHAIRRERERALAAGEEVLLLDAGDLFQGTPEGNLTRGEVIVAWMNRLGYDAVTVGNHEFDYGIEPVRQLSLRAEFPFLGANIREDQGGGRPAWLGRDADAGEETPEGLRGAVVIKRLSSPGAEAVVAVVGVTTSAMKELTVKGRTDGLSFAEEAATVEEVLAALPPVDVVVLLTHCGKERDEALARHFAGRVPVIIGGHSHDRLDEGLRVEDVLVAQAGARAARLGRVHLTLSPPRPSGADAGRPQVEARADLITLEDDIKALIGPYLRQVEEKVGLPPGGLEDAANPIGQLAAPLLRVREYESSALGNLLTDLMRRQAETDVAFQNKTGIRSDLQAGPVTWRDVYEVSPFGNTVVRMLLRGGDLRDLLENMLAEPYTLLEFSGLELVCDPVQPKGQRVLEVKVGGQPLDPDKLYGVATNNFLASGGDGHEAFTRGSHTEDTGVMIRSLVLEFFAQHSPYDPGITEQRLLLRQ